MPVVITDLLTDDYIPKWRGRLRLGLRVFTR
jgi:hypothetical protein